ncbi:MAG: hypothetical protein GTO02_07820 [Candidatus Dadabacteria bacterium]|nr:hypothetical protein [Candidatus Dadabacteria bacterium]
MAQYHTRAEQLKPLVLEAGFNTDQLNVILKMMRGCTMLRSGSVIDSFMSCMLDDSKHALTHGELKEGKYGSYRESLISEVNN